MLKNNKTVTIIVSVLLVILVTTSLMYRNAKISEHKEQLITVKKEVKDKKEDLKIIEDTRNEEMIKNLHYVKTEKDSQKELIKTIDENKKLEEELEKLTNE